MGLTADGDVSVASSSDVSVGGRTVRVSSAEDVDVTSGSDLRLSSGGEIEVVSGSGVVGRVVDSVEIVAGGVSLSSGSSMDVVGGDMSMSSDGSVTGYATGGRRLVHHLPVALCLAMRLVRLVALDLWLWAVTFSWDLAALAARRSVTACLCLAGLWLWRAHLAWWALVVRGGEWF